MAITRQDYKAGGTGSPPPGVAYNTACSIGDVLVATIQVSSGSSPGATTVSDTVNSGNWTLLNFQSDLVDSSSWLGTYFKVANAAGTPTVSCSQTSNQFGQLIIARYNGFVGTPTADAGITAVAHGTGTAVSCSPITTGYVNELLLVTQVSGSFTTGTITGWTAMNGNTFGSPFYESIETSSGTTDNFVGTLGTSGGWAVVAAGIGDVPIVTIYDGTTASGTVVSTGTGGTALPAFTVGQCIHVLMMAQTASALTETGPSDGHNTYVHLETADNHGTHGFIWDRWMTMVTVPITTPVITTTWSGTAKLAIAVGILTNINTGAPNVVGGNAQQFQIAPSGSNAQSSGLTTSPNLLVPVTLAGWGFSINETAAPAAGSGFSLIGTAWSALGGACLTYETMNSTAAAQQQATFTPVAGNAYTFMDMFYQIGSAPPTVPPSGPMPRQIYVMP